MISSNPITPKLTEAPLKERPTLDAAAYAEEIRARRGDIRTMESRLGLSAEPPAGWEWRWFNDVGDRVARAQADGWRFVSRASVGMSESVGRGNDSVTDCVSKTTTLGDGPIQTILMEIPFVIAEELRDIRSLSQVRKFEETVNRGGAVGITGDHTYIPGENPQSSFHGIRNTLGRQAA